MKRLRGVTAAMLTLFDEAGAVDHAAMRELTDFLIDRGVQGLYPLGTNGEMFRLTREERMQVAETVVKQAKGRCDVFVHCGAGLPEDTIALLRHAQSIGADGAGVVTPTFFGLSSAEKIAYYTTVAGSVAETFPVYLYSIPQLANNDLPLDDVKAITAACGNVVGIKLSAGDVGLLADYCTVNDGRFSVLPGFESLFLPGLACGCDGAISGISSVFPEPYVALYKAFTAGDMEEARRLAAIGNRYLAALQYGGSFALLKTALRMRGLRSGTVRAPSLELTAAQAEQLAATVKGLPAV